MKQALWHLLEDLLSAVVFLVALAASRNLDAAIGAVILVALVPLARAASQRRRLERSQWMSLGLSLALGVAAWLGQSPRFLMAKPTAIHFALVAAMSRAGWMMRYLNAPARENVPKAVVVGAGYAWAVLMAALGFTNLIIALYFDLRIWAWFVTVISVGAKILLLALQYVVFRMIVRRRLGRAGPVHARSAK